MMQYLQVLLGNQQGQFDFYLDLSGLLFPKSEEEYYPLLPLQLDVLTDLRSMAGSRPKLLFALHTMILFFVALQLPH
jgi:hypothetical protein